MTAPAGSEYTCGRCGGRFTRVFDDAKAIREAARDFGVVDASTDPGMVIVCDDCYRAMKAWWYEGDARS
jgi:hypothetical protein